MTRSIDYSTMSPALRAHVLQSFLDCFTLPTPRDQLQSALGLVLGLCGFDLGVDVFQVAAGDVERLNEIFYACADAVIATLADRGASLLDLPEEPSGGA